MKLRRLGAVTAVTALTTVTTLAVGCASPAGREDVEGTSSAWSAEGSTGVTVATTVLMGVADYAVAAQGINCREGAGKKYAPIAELSEGDELRAVDGGTGKERVRFSSDLKPWLRVLTPSGDTCYVSASYSFIRPADKTIPRSIVQETRLYQVFKQAECYADAKLSGSTETPYRAEEIVVAAIDASGGPAYAYDSRGRPFVRTERGCWVYADFMFMQPLAGGEDAVPELVDP